VGGGLIAGLVAVALVAGGVGGGVGFWAANQNSSTTITAASNPQDFSRPANSVAGIAKKALPSVVTIQATGSQVSGTGTGFVFDKQGHILTNNHVVAPAANGGKLTATFSNGKTYTAQVVGQAQGYDVAVIKLVGISPSQLTPLALGNSATTAVGDATIAIGAPFGLSGTVTTGIVSALHRPIASSDGTSSSSASYMSAIQTDASINPGNSGGPLLNAAGAVIGIDSAIQSSGSPSGSTQAGSIGLGFAIPINEAKRVAQQLITTGKPVYPVLEVSVDPNYAGQGAKISTASGAVTPGGPAAKAGLQPGDVITNLGGTVIDSSPTLIAEIWQHTPGQNVQVTYDRGGSSHTVTVTLGQRVGP
jgi:putative serine protease PepD